MILITYVWQWSPRMMTTVCIKYLARVKKRKKKWSDYSVNTVEISHRLTTNFSAKLLKAVCGPSFQNIIQAQPPLVNHWHTTPGRLSDLFHCPMFNSYTLYAEIGLLQQTIIWYKICHAGGQTHHYSRTGTLKERQVKIDWLRSLCFTVTSQCGNNNELALQHGGFRIMWSKANILLWRRRTFTLLLPPDIAFL